MKRLMMLMMLFASTAMAQQPATEAECQVKRNEVLAARNSYDGHDPTYDELGQIIDNVAIDWHILQIDYQGYVEGGGTPIPEVQGHINIAAIAITTAVQRRMLADSYQVQSALRLDDGDEHFINNDWNDAFIDFKRSKSYAINAEFRLDAAEMSILKAEKEVGLAWPVYYENYNMEGPMGP